jgi:cytochrome c-type biogenesis protein CcmH
MKKILIFVALLFIPIYGLFAAEDYYSFNSSVDQARFQTLTAELRCLVCQNQNLAESNSSLATDLRGQIYHKIQKGQTDKEIVDYLVQRYGNFILYNPPVNIATLGLWMGPFLILIFGLAYLIYYLRNSSKKHNSVNSQE